MISLPRWLLGKAAGEDLVANEFTQVWRRGYGRSAFLTSSSSLLLHAVYRKSGGEAWSATSTRKVRSTCVPTVGAS